MPKPASEQLPLNSINKNDSACSLNILGQFRPQLMKRQDMNTCYSHVPRYQLLRNEATGPVVPPMVIAVADNPEIHRITVHR